MIPVFSIQRSQRVLYRLHQAYGSKGLPDGIKVYFDSPMAIEATEIFEKFLFEREEGLMRKDLGKNPFSFPGLEVTREAWESRKKMKKDKGAKVIVAGSGMMTGGRILSHAAKYLPGRRNRLLIVGYQAEETLGRKILEGAKRVVIGKKEVEVGAEISEIKSMSAHADYNQLLSWLLGIGGVSKVILTHGEEEPRRVLEEKIKEKKSVEVVRPGLKETIEI